VPKKYHKSLDDPGYLPCGLAFFFSLFSFKFMIKGILGQVCPFFSFQLKIIPFGHEKSSFEKKKMLFLMQETFFERNRKL
jgi:hypothetical protein